MLNKPFLSLMYDFLIVPFLWDVSSFSPQFSDWTEGNPEYFSNISHQTIFQIPMVKKINSDVREDFFFFFQGFQIGDVSYVKVMLPPPFLVRL